MLKKFINRASTHLKIQQNDPVFIVTRKGEIIEGYCVKDVLMDLVSLDRSPLDGTEKQGFTIEGDLLRPNWCAGKRVFEAACLSRQHAEKVAEKVIEERKEGIVKPITACTNRKMDKTR